MTPQLKPILDQLVEKNVEFVVIGGVAIVLHGSARATWDLDLCYSRSDKNILALADALAPFKPWLRGAPRELPFRVDGPTLKAGLNFTLRTDLGDLDLLGEVPGVGDFNAVAAGAVPMDLFGHRVP